MNLNEMLEMLEKDVLSGMEKKASDNKEESKEVPAVAPEFTKSASARKEAEELGARVAQTLLKQAEESKAEEKKEEEKKEEKDEDKKEEKSESKEETPNFLKKEENMDKKASLVDIITGMLEKSALEGDANTAAGVPEGVTPNKIQVDSAAMVNDFNSVQAPTPGTDGVKDGGTVNQILDAIVAKAQTAGADPYDLNSADKGPTTAVEAERNDENVEKTAAVVALVEAGVDFDQAVDLVKQAEVELKAEAFEVEKQAAFSALIEAGIDFDQATDLVKEACEDLEKQAGGFKDGAKKLYDAAKTEAVKASVGADNLQFGLRNAGSKAGRKIAGKGVKQLASNNLVRAGAGTTAAAGAAYAMNKKSAFDQLIADGFDYETAVNSVKQASDSLGM